MNLPDVLKFARLMPVKLMQSVKKVGSSCWKDGRNYIPGKILRLLKDIKIG
jgi:hypothetical protein